MKADILFMMHVEVFNWALLLLLWPLAVWKLGGEYLWVRFVKHSQVSFDAESKMPNHHIKIAHYRLLGRYRASAAYLVVNCL